MTWAPAQHEPSALDLLLIDAARAFVVPAAAIGTVTRDADGVLVVARPGGLPVRAVFRIAHDAQVTFGPRSARRIDLQGRAVFGTRSLVIGADVVVDLTTGAFLLLTVTILSET